jgi:hypothetical protein
MCASTWRWCAPLCTPALTAAACHLTTLSCILLPPPPHPPAPTPFPTNDVRIRNPQGVILYGEPGTGKTLLAKAVANSTSATFLRVVGSELIQKYLGDGPKLVRELFRVADELAPSIVFIGVFNSGGWGRGEGEGVTFSFFVF